MHIAYRPALLRQPAVSPAARRFSDRF